MAFGLGKIGDIAKKLATVARDTTPAYQVYKNRKKIASGAKKAASAGGKAARYVKKNTPKAALMLLTGPMIKRRKGKKKLSTSYKTADATLASRRGKKLRKPMRKLAPKRGGKGRRRNPSRPYSGTPMNRASVTAAVAAAMKKRKK